MRVWPTGLQKIEPVLTGNLHDGDLEAGRSCRDFRFHTRSKGLARKRPSQRRRHGVAVGRFGPIGIVL